MAFINPVLNFEKRGAQVISEEIGKNKRVIDVFDDGKIIDSKKMIVIINSSFLSSVDHVE